MSDGDVRITMEDPATLLRRSRNIRARYKQLSTIDLVLRATNVIDEIADRSIDDNRSHREKRIAYLEKLVEVERGLLEKDQCDEDTKQKDSK